MAIKDRSDNLSCFFVDGRYSAAKSSPVSEAGLKTASLASIYINDTHFVVLSPPPYRRSRPRAVLQGHSGNASQCPPGQT